MFNCFEKLVVSYKAKHIFYDLAIPLLDNYPKELKTLYSQKDLCTNGNKSFTHNSKNWKQHKCSSTDTKRMNQLFIQENTTHQ